MNVFNYSAVTITGEEKALSDYSGKILLIVNTASKCGFTPQFKELQALYEEFKDKGFEILGFPCNQFMSQDPGTDDKILSFCETNYGVNFQMFSKIDVNGSNAHPLFKYLTSEKPGFLGGKIKWNFTKFLVGKKGEVIKRYAPQSKPESIKADIESLLNT